MARLMRLRIRRGNGRDHSHPQQASVVYSCIGMLKSSAAFTSRSTYSAPSTSLRTARPLSHSSLIIATSFRWSSWSGEGMGELADALDPQLDRVAGLEEPAPAYAHPRRGPGEDEIARVQGHARREHRGLLGGVEDELGGVRVLHQLAVYPQPDPELVRIAHLARRNDPGPERARAVEALLAHPVVVK